MKQFKNKEEIVFNFIDKYITDNNFPPSVREIAYACNIKSTSNVQYYIDKLKVKGLIASSPNKNRSVTISNKNTCTYAPLVGKVSAGEGIFAFEDVDGEYPLPSDFFGDNDLFLLRVKGDSMINAEIDDGDLVVVHKQSNVNLNEIAVVFWQDKATIKRIVATTPNLVLHPENDSMSDIVIEPKDNPIILGKVVGSMKKF